MRRESALPSMGDLERLVQYQKEQRKSRRFAFRQSAILRHYDGISHQLIAETQNASLHGVLLSVPEPIPHASRVEVELRLCMQDMQGVSLRGEGRVVRNEVRRSGEFGIAIAFDQPLTEKSQPATVSATLANRPTPFAPRLLTDPKVR